MREYDKKKTFTTRALTSLIGGASLTTLLASAAHAQTSVTLYGYLNTDIEHVQASGGQGQAVPGGWRMVNDLSKIGMRGSENLGNGYKAIFQLEGTVGINNGSGSSLNNRDSFVGLDTPYGTLTMGFQQTPYKNASWIPIDPFVTNTIAGANSIMGNGFTSAGNAQSPASFDRRQANGVTYFTPTWRGLSAQLAYSLPNEKTALSTPSLFSGALLYRHGPIYLAYAYEQHNSYFGPGTTDTGHKIAASYQWGRLSLRAAGERLRYEPTPGTWLARIAWQLAAVYRTGPHILRLSYVQAQAATGNATVGVGGIAAPGADGGARQIALGYGYTLSKQTELYAIYSRLINRGRSAYNFSTNQVAGISPGANVSGYGIGIVHTF